MKKRSIWNILFIICIFVLFCFSDAKYVLAEDDVEYSEEEIKWINDHKKVVIGYWKNYMPYSDSDSEGNPKGMIKELAEKMVSISEYSKDTELVFVSYENYDKMTEDLVNEKIDMAFPVGGGEEYAKKDGIYLSKPVLSSSIDLIYKGDFPDKENFSVAVNKNNSMQYYYINNHLPDVDIVLYSSINECLQAVIDGLVDATTVNGIRVNALLRNSDYDSLKYVPLANSDDRSFGIKIGNDVLCGIINKSIDAIGERYITNLAYVYSEDLYQYSFVDFIKDNIAFLIAIAIGIVVLIIIIFIIINHKSRKDLEYEEDRNRELQEAHKEQEIQMEEIRLLNENIATRMDIIESMSKVYFTSYYLDLENDTFEELSSRDYIRKAVGKNGSAQATLFYMCERMLKPEFIAPMREFTDLSTINERLSDRNVITIEYKGLVYGWCQAFFIAGDRDENNRLKHIFYSTRMIHEEKAKEEEHNRTLADALSWAQNANKAKTAFLNNMSHDIRTPMNAIIGFTKLAQSNIDNKEKITDYLSKIDVSSQHLLSLINDVLDMSRIESGNINIEEKRMRISELTNEIKTMIQPNVLAKQQTFIIDTSEVVHNKLYADKLRINQVLINVISNAVKFTPVNGEIRLTILEKESKIPEHSRYEFIIKDNGIGMSEEFKSHVFEAFSREQTSTVSGIQGTGLGMAISKNIVDMMGGKISFESEENVGTEFKICLDLRIMESTENDNSTENELENWSMLRNVKDYDFTGKKVLLVEDNVLNREIATEILKGTGIEVDVAEDGDIAVDIIKKSPAFTYEVILMDIQMPRMNGYEATKIIRGLEDEDKANIPILAMTANAFEEDREKAYLSGMNGHLAKPINVPELMDSIYKILIKRGNNE